MIKNVLIKHLVLVDLHILYELISNVVIPEQNQI